ncbi:MAG: hypothetical protein LBK03_02655 [Bacteroidales bacterium]|nr:hypothetical protein [Bacteroidales bacterium]
MAIAISTALLAARCTKPKTYYLEQETKDYCLFDVGSYWIFQDSATLKTDSLVITKVTREMVPVCPECGEDLEVYDILYAYFQEDTSILMYGMLRCHTGDSPDDFSVLPYQSVYTDKPVGTGSYKAYYESYSIANFTYSDVKEFSLERYGLDMFFAKHIGCIRFEINTNETDTVYNLIRYNIKPYNK